MTLTLKNEPLELISGAALNLPTKFGEDRPKDLGEVGEQTEKKQILTFDLDDLDLSKNEPLKLISGAALHHTSKFGEDLPKDLGDTEIWPLILMTLTFKKWTPRAYILGRPQPSHQGLVKIGPRTWVVGEQTERNINLTFDLDDLDLLKNEPLKPISGATHHPAKFGEIRPKNLGDTEIWPLTSMTLTFNKWTSGANIRGRPQPSHHVWWRSAQGPEK